jgi:hypothetical protein
LKRVMSPATPVSEREYGITGSKNLQGQTLSGDSSKHGITLKTEVVVKARALFMMGVVEARKEVEVVGKMGFFFGG